MQGSDLSEAMREDALLELRQRVVAPVVAHYSKTNIAVENSHTFRVSVNTLSVSNGIDLGIKRTPIDTSSRLPTIGLASSAMV